MTCFIWPGFGTDERTHVTEAVAAELRRRGHELVLNLADGAQGPGEPWPAVARAVAEAVAAGAADEGILFCWTGTGVSMAANKVPGIRAALCDDAETARGARLWNNANVLCLSAPDQRGDGERDNRSLVRNFVHS